MMSPYIGGASLEDALPSGLPTVLMNTHESAGIAAAFVVDDFGGARAMTAHLVAAGYQDIAHIRGPANDFQSLERVRGYRAGQIGRAHSELQSQSNLVCRLLLEKKKNLGHAVLPLTCCMN